MAVLLALAEARGQLMSKQHLLEEVWGGVYVVEGVVARSIYQLRKALAQADDGLNYVETHRASGYRLTLLPLPIAAGGHGDFDRSGNEVGELQSATLRSRSWSYAAAAVMTCALAVLVWISSTGPLSSLPSRSAQALSEATIRPGTSLKGQESFPRLSRDGQWTAFIRYDPNRQRSEILETRFGEQEPKTVASLTGRVSAIAYSPGRDQIAYSVIRGRGSSGRCSVEVLTLSEGTSTHLADCGISSFAHLDWHPKRQQLALAWLEPGKTHSTLDLIDFETDVRRRTVFEAPPEQPLLLLPRFAPDGGTLAFGTRANPIGSTVWKLDLGEKVSVQKLQRLEQPLLGLDWWEGDRALIASLKDRGNTFADLLVVGGPNAGTRTRIDRLDSRFTYLATASSAPHAGLQDRLIGIDRSVDVDLMTVAFAEEEQSSVNLDALQSTYSETHPVISPDGSKIAYRSTRNGSVELFICALPCTSPMQVSRFGVAGGDSGTPSWSPDGTRLVVAAAFDEGSTIHVFDAVTGASKFAHGSDQILRFPAFSADGTGLVFTSHDQGAWVPWQLDLVTSKTSPIGSFQSDKILPLPSGGYASIRCGDGRIEVLDRDLSVTASFVGLDTPYCYYVEARGQSLFFLRAPENGAQGNEPTLEVMEWPLNEVPRSISRIDARRGLLGFSIDPSREFVVVSVDVLLEGNLFLAEI